MRTLSKLGTIRARRFWWLEARRPARAAPRRAEVETPKPKARGKVICVVRKRGRNAHYPNSKGTVGGVVLVYTIDFWRRLFGLWRQLNTSKYYYLSYDLFIFLSCYSSQSANSYTGYDNLGASGDS